MNSKNYELAQKIIDVCKWLEEKAFVIGTWGNVSVRCDEGFILTPSRIEYKVLKPTDLVIVGLDGKVVQGHHNPSSEKEVHRQIYLARDDVNAVIHCHSLYATAVSCTGDTIPPLLEEMSQLLGGEIFCTQDYVPAAEHADLGKATAAAIKDKNAVLIKNHGPVCCGKDLEEAQTVCCVLEKCAQIYMHVREAGNYKSIPQKYVDSERYRYVNTYGKEAT